MTNQANTPARAALIAHAQEKIEDAQRALDKWAADFAKDPIHALKWAERAYEAAAELRVYSVAMEFLNSDSADDVVAQGLIDHAQQTVYSGVNSGRSTSACSNESDRQETAVWSKIAMTSGWGMGSRLAKMAAGE